MLQCLGGGQSRGLPFHGLQSSGPTRVQQGPGPIQARPDWGPASVSRDTHSAIRSIASGNILRGQIGADAEDAKLGGRVIVSRNRGHDAGVAESPVEPAPSAGRRAPPPPGPAPARPRAVAVPFSIPAPARPELTSPRSVRARTSRRGGSSGETIDGAGTGEASRHSRRAPAPARSTSRSPVIATMVRSGT